MYIWHVSSIIAYDVAVIARKVGLHISERLFQLKGGQYYSLISHCLSVKMLGKMLWSPLGT